MVDSMEYPESRLSHSDSQTRSEVSGTAKHVVQARDVAGGVHFHVAESSDSPRPQQLPGDVRGFINRAAELARLDTVLSNGAEADSTSNVVIITGTAGVGKTSLALCWAHKVRSRFPDGQFYVNMRGYDPGEPVTALDALDRFLRALGTPASHIPPDEQSRSALFRSLMADRRMLIMLDNAATVGQVRPLLPGTDGCLVLISSRNRLSGLVARDGAERITIETFTEVESVALLRRVTFGYRALDESQDLAHLARLCAYLPLALRIAAERAAARPRMLLADLIADLQDESALWDALSTEDDEAADAVRTVFAWSYRALAPDAARLFRVLGLHPGPEFSSEAAAALVGTELGRTRRVLDNLVGVHLLEQVGHDRYQFHDLLHAYATDQARHEEPPAQQRRTVERAVDWYLHTANAAAQTSFPDNELIPVPLDLPDTNLNLIAFADYDAAIAWYDIERENLIATTRAAAKAGLGHVAWKIPAVLRTIYGTRDPINSWFEAEEAALSAARRSADHYGEAVMHLWLGISHRFLRRFIKAAECYAAASTLFSQLGDPLGHMLAANGLGLVHLQCREPDQARIAFEQYVIAARSTGNDIRIGTALINLGQASARLGDLETADTHLVEAIERLHDRDSLYECEALTNLAAVRSQRGLAEQARANVEQALSIAQECNDPMSEAFALLELARLELTDSHAEAALIAAQQAAMQFRQREDRNSEATAWGLIGEAHRIRGALDEAIAFHQQAASAHRDLGDSFQHSVDLDRMAVALFQAGDPVRAQTHWTRSLEEMVNLVDNEAAVLRARVTLALEAMRPE